jgi:hypothetical protein
MSFTRNHLRKRLITLVVGAILITSVGAITFSHRSTIFSHPSPAKAEHPIDVGSSINDDGSITLNITSYGFNDNDDGNGNFGTAQIAYPIIHSIATEGSGTADDPITFATDANEFAPGTIIYVPYLQKFFIMEDGCVECTADWQNGIYHIDLWMGPNDVPQPEPALDDCEGSITRTDVVYVNPDPSLYDTLPVDDTPMFSDGQCNVSSDD